MIEAYLAYGLVVLFFIILFILVYFAQIKARPATSSNAPMQQPTTSSKPDEKDPSS
jgi:preprotein translocase subunit SecG